MANSKRVKFIQNASGNRMHRKQRVSTARIISYFFEYVGDLLYYLGLTIEREYRNNLRSIRRTTKKVFTKIGRFFSYIFRTLGRFMLTVILDFLNPFIKIGRSIKSLSVVLKAEKKKGVKAYFSRFRYFLKYGWIWNKHLLVRFFNQLIPIVAMAGFILALMYFRKLNFALKVQYEGESIGYVATEQIYDSATDIIRERMVESSDMSWTSNIKLGVSVAPPEEIISNKNVADNMLTVSGIGITQATGLYIDNQFYGATTEGEELSDSLKALLEVHRQSLVEGEIHAEFANNIELRDGVYPEESIIPYESLDNFIHSTKRNAQYYVVVEGETITDVLEICRIPIDTIQWFNPNIDLLNLHAGQKLIISDEEPMLPIRITRTEMLLEEIPIEVEEYQDPNRDANFSYEYVSGEAGLKEVYYEVSYDEGVEIGRTIVNETVTQEMIKRIIVRGTKKNVGFGGRPPSTNGILGWPTGSFQFVSRGTNDSGHIALDIAAETGTNVFAAEAGTVVTSEWTNTGYGYYIIIDHGVIDGVHLSTLYAHNSDLLVVEGTQVARGQLIAYSGSTGNSTGPHLHFEVRVDGVKTPPEAWVGLG